MYQILRNGPSGARLESDAVLSRADFDRIAADLAAAPFRARKSGYVDARKAIAEERVRTLWNGTESVNVAKPGDYVVTNVGRDRNPLRDAAGATNTYVIAAARMTDLYEKDGDLWRARAIVDALLLPGGFAIVAPWGETQRGDTGYLLRNGPDVYGNHKDTFEATYDRLA